MILQKLFFIILLLCSYTNINFAQSKVDATPEQKEKIAKQIADYFEMLNLTETQHAKYETITKKYFADLKALKASNSNRLYKYYQYQSLKDKRNRKMKKLLNKEQYKVYFEMQEKLDEAIKARRNQ